MPVRRGRFAVVGEYAEAKKKWCVVYLTIYGGIGGHDIEPDKCCNDGEED
jgi:hypothetical protein